MGLNVAGIMTRDRSVSSVQTGFLMYAAALRTPRHVNFAR